ncbi:MAG TPA: carboxypeptidase regulatory-like domain-containing protein [Gemmatimonadales bacterium]|nr:carboxypeptidase regulatory-like domain-containing protein [Gemmatimonadales bacterium]
MKLALSCSLLAGPLWAQDPAPVQGRVIAPDSTRVAGALVEVVRTSDSTRTSATGEFRFARVAVGRQSLRIRMLGYAIKVQDIDVSAASGWSGTIMLEAGTVTLPEVAVTSPYDKPEAYANTSKYDDFFRRRKLGIGTFRTREEIEAKASYDLVSVLQGIPSVGVSKTHNFNSETEVRFRLPRCTPPRVGFYVDGRKVGNFLNEPKEGGGIKSICEDCARLAEAMESLHLRDIEFVEFYRGPSQVPPELDRGDSCAALVVWTR